MSLTNRQQRFIDEYLVDLNAAQAAIRAGYSPKNANANVRKTLQNPIIKAEIERRMEEKKSELIADQDEVLRSLTEVLRNTEEEATRDRLKAAELLGKRFGLWTDKINLEGALPIVIDGYDEIED